MGSFRHSMNATRGGLAMGRSLVAGVAGGVGGSRMPFGARAHDTSRAGSKVDARATDAQTTDAQTTNARPTEPRSLAAYIAARYDARLQQTHDVPEWRNWQTRGTQNPVRATECGFDPHLRHQSPECFSTPTSRTSPLWKTRTSAFAARSAVRRRLTGKLPIPCDDSSWFASRGGSSSQRVHVAERRTSSHSCSSPRSRVHRSM